MHCAEIFSQFLFEFDTEILPQIVLVWYVNQSPT